MTRCPPIRRAAAAAALALALAGTARALPVVGSPGEAPPALLPTPRASHQVARPVAWATATARARASAFTDTLRAHQVTFLGDSVLLGAEPALRETFGESAVVDGDVSRQYGLGLERLRQLKAAGAVNEVLIVHLGHNGVITREQLDETMRLVGDVPYVYFLTVRLPRPWAGEVNEALRAARRRWPNLRLIDWHHAAGGVPELFTGDEVHLRPAGARFYAAYIARRLVADWRAETPGGAVGRGLR